VVMFTYPTLLTAVTVPYVLDYQAKNCAKHVPTKCFILVIFVLFRVTVVLDFCIFPDIGPGRSFQ